MINSRMWALKRVTSLMLQTDYYMLGIKKKTLRNVYIE